MSGTGRKTRRTTIEVNDRIALETAQAGPVPHDSIAAIMKDRANPDIEIVSKPIIQELSLARILSGVAEFNYEKNMRDTIDKDDIHSSGSFNQSQAGAGPTQADAETSRFRPRKPVQYMPVARSSRAPQLLMGQKSDDAYLADIPAVLSEEERRADEARYLLDKSDMLVDASLSESDLARYLTRVQAKVIISRINPPAANAVLLGDSTDISTGEGSTSEEDFLPTAAETDSVSAAKRQPPPTAGADRKRTRLTRSKAFLEEPPEQLCDSNSGIIFVDGALVLMHPNIHEFFVLVLKKCHGDITAALVESEQHISNAVVLWTPQEQELFAEAHAKYGDNIERIYLEISSQLISKNFKSLVDYFYRCIVVAKEMESQVPEMQIKPATRGSSQRLLALDAAEEEKAATINANSAVAVPRREGRMSTRGKATVPSWQRSDIYELDAPSPTFSDSDTDDVSTSVQDSKLKALFFIKRASTLLDPFSFSQLLNALLLFDKKQLKASELVVRVRNLCKVADDSALVVSAPGLTLFHAFLNFLPPSVQNHMIKTSMLQASAENY